MKIPLAKPDITKKEISAVEEVLKISRLSLGKKYLEFEKALAEYVGVKYVVVVNSGTSALHLIIRALNIKEGDEVITSPFSFVASANCALFEGAKPIFCDIDEDTLNINTKKIEDKITEKTKAILVPDIFSHPADWSELEQIAKKHKLFLIEDSAEALGSEYNGRKCGSFGEAAVFAFYPNKQITTGEGGAVLTNSQKVYELCKSMANQGRKNENGEWLEHIMLGYNYRLDEMSCALGLAQLGRIDEILEKRSKVAELYSKKLSSSKDLKIPHVKLGSKLSWFVYVVKLNNELAGIKRDKIIEKMKEKGIQCGKYFQSIHLQPFYKEKFDYKEGDFPVAENVSERSLALPFFNSLKEKEIDSIVESLKKSIDDVKIL